MSNPMAKLQEASIKAYCKVLRMPMVAEQFGTLADQAVREKKSHVGYLEALLLAEVEERERNTIERRLRDAHLPRLKALEEFDYTPSPNVTRAVISSAPNRCCSSPSAAQGKVIWRRPSANLPFSRVTACGTGKRMSCWTIWRMPSRKAPAKSLCIC